MGRRPLTAVFSGSNPVCPNITHSTTYARLHSRRMVAKWRQSGARALLGAPTLSENYPALYSHAQKKGKSSLSVKKPAMAKTQENSNGDLHFTTPFEPTTIEHLGLRLYGTLPPVISELASKRRRTRTRTTGAAPLAAGVRPVGSTSTRGEGDGSYNGREVCRMAFPPSGARAECGQAHGDFSPPPQRLTELGSLRLDSRLDTAN